MRKAIAGPLLVIVGGEVYCRYDRICLGHSFEICCPKCDWVQRVDASPGAPFQLQMHAQHCIDEHREWVRSLVAKSSRLGVAAFVPGNGFVWKDRDEVIIDTAATHADVTRHHAIVLDNYNGQKFTIHVPRMSE
jgi:hypothetical protein